MTLKHIITHVAAFAFFIYEAYSFIKRTNVPEVVNVEAAIIMFLQAGIIFFALPAIYMGEVLSRIFNIELGHNFFQLKLFYWFLYFLLISFAVLEIIGKIVY